MSLIQFRIDALLHRLSLIDLFLLFSLLRRLIEPNCYFQFERDP